MDDSIERMGERGTWLLENGLVDPPGGGLVKSHHEWRDS